MAKEAIEKTVSVSQEVIEKVGGEKNLRPQRRREGTKGTKGTKKEEITIKIRIKIMRGREGRGDFTTESRRRREKIGEDFAAKKRKKHKMIGKSERL